jgi:hypothetical protein
MIKRVKTVANPVVHPILMVQIISTSWRQDQSGGKQATIRNQSPEALKLPSLADPLFSAPLSEPTFVVDKPRHILQCGGRWVRYPTEELLLQSAREDLLCDAIRVEFREGGLHVNLEWGPGCGMPRRHSIPDMLVMRPGQWARIRYNSRTSALYYDGTWVYQKWVFNIGVFNEIKPRVFIDSEPKKICSLMKEMW